MSALAPDHPFLKHSENLATVKKGLLQMERVHKAMIRTSHDAAVATIARFHVLAVGLMAEAFLRKILWDPGGFNDRERAILQRVSSQMERWKEAVNYAFRRHYSVPVHLDLATALEPDDAAKHASLLTLLDTHLGGVIDDRNKTAHAQWRWHLNSKETAFTGLAPPTLNYRAIKVRSDLIVAMGNLVNVLAVSEPTFQRDFDDLIAEIDLLVPDVDGADYSSFVEALMRSKPSRR